MAALTSTTPAATSLVSAHPRSEEVASECATPTVTTNEHISHKDTSEKQPFNYLPADINLTVEKVIAEQMVYNSKVHSDGPVPQNITKIISNRRPVALYADLLARTKFNPLPKEGATTIPDNATIDYLQNIRDSQFKNWSLFFAWCLEQLKKEGHGTGNAETIKYLNKRQSIA
ncbi:hypothetical protein FBU30_000704, partial [Linnemannia zychae]